MTKEKSFEVYFAKQCPSYRMSLINPGGFPDRLIINERGHFLVELKVLKIGASGDKMLRGCYQPTQMPWHLDYLVNRKGKSLYTLFKLDGKYGIVHETESYCKAVLDGLKYKQLGGFRYTEYKVLKELIREEF